MISQKRKNSFLYHNRFLVIIGILFALWIVVFDQYTSRDLILILGSYFGIFMFIRFISFKEQRKIVKYLYVECNPEKCISYIQSVLKRGVNKRKEFFLQTWLSDAISCSGENDRALEILNNLDVNNKKNNSYDRVIFYYVKSACYRRKGKYEDAKIALDKMRDCISILILSERIKEQYNILLLEGYIFMILERDNYENVNDIHISIIHTVLENAKYNITVVAMNDILGRIYMNQKKYEEAKKCFEYVVSKGNKLFHVQKAKKYLEELHSINN